MKKNILMLVGDFVEDYEAFAPLQILKMMGHNVDVVCPNKKNGDYVKTAIHDFEGDQTYTEKPGHNLLITEDFDKINADHYHALVVPGGRAPEYLRLDNRVLQLTRAFARENKPIATICHGPQILAAAGVLEGKQCSCYPTVKFEVERSGGKYVETNDTYSNAFTDGNIVSAPAWPAIYNWMDKFIKIL